MEVKVKKKRRVYGKELSCVNCNANYYAAPSAINKGSKFCSKKCKDSNAKGTYKGTIEEKFWSKVDKTGDCWLWLGGKTLGGYGCFDIKRKTKVSHRVSYKMAYGDIPEGLFVCHKCDNRSCVNPEHMFLGTHSDNMKDMIAKGRSNNSQSNKTHCPKGHPYSGRNLIIKKMITGRPGRICRVCNNYYANQRKRAKRQLASQLTQLEFTPTSIAP